MKDFMPFLYTMGYIWMGYITGWICYEFYEKWDFAELLGIEFFWPITLPIVLMHVIVDNIKTRRRERKNAEENVLKKLHKFAVQLIDRKDLSQLSQHTMEVYVVAPNMRLAGMIALKYFTPGQGSGKWIIADIQPVAS